VGSNGRALLLLSGGIDSPVAAWLTAARGVELEALHFHSYPFTSDRAQEKVRDLARRLAPACGPLRVHLVNLLPIQETIHGKCPAEMMTILSRRFMMRIGERIADMNDCQALVTGESLGQVASQTLESLTVTDQVTGLPVLRPLIGVDKLEITEVARRIGTYETSILPYEDCCTVFLPRRPVTKPTPDRVEDAETPLDVDALVDQAVRSVETELFD
jgi:thiamine biosynthesis protein ThiI